MRLTALISNRKHCLTLLAMSGLSLIGFSQNEYRPAVESFESPATVGLYKTENAELKQSDAHRWFGNASLEWTWDGESSIGTKHFRILSKKESPLLYGDHFPASPTLQMSIYSEAPQDGSITISFEKDGKAEVHFDINLDFKGWRRIWVPFYEMKGNAPKKGHQVAYDYFKISTTSSKGKLFFDDIVFSQYQDDRHQYPDEIVPFIKADLDLGADHWMPLIKNYERIINLDAGPVSMAIRMDLKSIEQQIDQDLTIAARYLVYMNTLKEDFNTLKLRDIGTTVLGPPLTFRMDQEYQDKKQQGSAGFLDISDLGKVMNKLSKFYDRATPPQQKEIADMFLMATKYYLDQGWVAGSNGGTRHHIGYGVREITEAFFRMRTLLYQNGFLDEVGASLHWVYNLGMLLDDPDNFFVNIDYLNTQSYFHLMMIFLFESQEKQAALLAAYSKYLSITLAQEKEEWGFKPDGSAWHHNGHYPAYGLGAFSTMPKIMKILSTTRFRIRPEGHRNFKRAFLTLKDFSQLYNWGFGNSGRHPLENGGIEPLKNPFLMLALTGNPEGTEAIDKDVAAAYLRLWGDEDVLNTSILTGVNNISKERLSGYKTLPYAATAVHRRNNWAAMIKGYSKYVWASEIYVDENRYGRYPANGTIQLLNSGSEKGSGFRQEGWDWNRYPGATIIYLPFEELEPKMPLIMFRSNETFAGATQLDGNGIFGMILNEGKGSNADGKEVNVGFPGKLRAKKSVFSFDGKLIAIGTNISSIDQKNPTQTNIFQSYLDDKKQSLYTSDGEIKKFPMSEGLKSDGKSKRWLVDPYGSGYYILSDNNVHYKKEHQKSYHNKYSINSGGLNAKAKGVKNTEGDYASAWIDHGMAPDNGSYQYVIYPFLCDSDQKNFGKMAEKDKSYDIKRADSIAHIVYDLPSKTTGYVIFEANKDLESGILEGVSEPALVMIKENSDSLLTLSAVQPDLNFPEYQKGKYRNYSQPVELTITLDGKWSPFAEEFIKSTTHADGKTIIKLELINGLPRVFNLNKI